MSYQSEDIIDQLSSINECATSSMGTLDEIATDAGDKIGELDTLKQEAENVSCKLEEYIGKLDGLKAALDDFDQVVSTAQELDCGGV
jgi:hypothetical protein